MRDEQSSPQNHNPDEDGGSARLQARVISPSVNTKAAAGSSNEVTSPTPSHREKPIPHQLSSPAGWTSSRRCFRQVSYSPLRARDECFLSRRACTTRAACLFQLSESGSGRCRGDRRCSCFETVS
ncbi:hypothetical protein ANO14919_092130 [Xylariales sp. No.14919]|nr:hypothetical protein ANO14919_092130 [Xylariales sp. No.14919]